jgi:hypothetical protein
MSRTKLPTTLYTQDKLPVRKLRPIQAARVYGVSVDYLADLDPATTGRSRITRKLTTYDVACLERHFAPDETTAVVLQ